MSYLEMLSKLGIGSAHPGGFTATLELFETFPVDGDTRLLDVGCGTGRTACWLAGQGAIVTGLDISADMLRKARLRSKEEDVKVQWVRGDVCRLPFADGSFDVVMAESVTVFADPERAIAEYYRVLRPGGLLLEREIYAVDLLPDEVLEGLVEVYGIRRMPTMKEWRDCLIQAGFRDDGVWGPGKFPEPEAVWDDHNRHPDPYQHIDGSLFGDLELLDVMMKYDRFMMDYRHYFGYGVFVGRKAAAGTEGE